MSDTVSRLLAALEALERTIVHRDDCDFHELNHVGGDSWIRGECTCDYDVRRRLAIAQRIAAAITAAGNEGAAAERAAWNVIEYHGDSDETGVAAFASPGREREDT